MSIHIDQLEAGIRELPPLSEAVVEIVDALKQKDVSIDFLRQKIIQDPAMVSKVLSVANSPFYGMSGHISSINDACIVLGLNTLSNITIAVGIVDNFPANRGHHIDFKGLWQHAIGTGVAARVLAEKCKIDQELAFTAGMLHDIGMMVFDQCFPIEYEQVMKMKSDNYLLYEAEREVLGMDHGLFGAMMVKRWNLSSEIVDAIHNYHSANLEQCSKLADLISIADIVSRGLEIGDPGDDLIPLIRRDTLSNLGLDMDEIVADIPLIAEQNILSESLLES